MKNNPVLYVLKMTNDGFYVVRQNKTMKKLYFLLYRREDYWTGT